jgi:hypothetical protein
MKSQLRPSCCRALGLLAGLVGLATIATACGKKGPPLAPLLRLPAAVGDFAGRRLGSTAYVRFKVPEANQDGTRPADIARVAIYAFNGVPAKADDVVKAGTLVATIPIRRPPLPPEDRSVRGERTTRAKGKEELSEKEKTRADKEKAKADEEAARRAEAEKKRLAEPGFELGALVTVTDEITEAVASTRPPPLPIPKGKPVPAAGAGGVTEIGMPDQAGAVGGQRASGGAGAGGLVVETPERGRPTTRVYVAVGINHRGRRGVLSPQVAIPLSSPGDAPSALSLKYDEHAVTLTWTPPAGLRRPMQEPGEGERLPSKILLPSSLATRYNVYEVPSEAAKAAPAAKGTAAPPPLASPTPLNAKPLETPTFDDPRVEFGVERCYVVRTVDGTANLEQESAPSARVCVALKDIFPPAAPKGLAAVWSNGGVNLNWEPNSEVDLAGYLVMRGEASGGALQPLMQEPIHTTTWLDTTVRAGVRYVYAVVAVDTAKPPNVSALSNKVEETARQPQ